MANNRIVYVSFLGIGFVFFCSYAFASSDPALWRGGYAVTEAEKPYLQTFLRILESLFQKELENHPDTPAEIKRAGRLLLDPNSEPLECEQAVIELLRKAYITSGYEFGERRRIAIMGKSIAAFPEILFWLKGSPVGLYEYYRLAGMPSEFMRWRMTKKYDPDLVGFDWASFWRSWLQASPMKAEMLVSFELSRLIQELPEAYIEVYVLGRDSPLTTRNLQNDLTTLLEYFPDNKRVREFAIRYPFMTGSNLDILRRYSRHFVLSLPGATPKDRLAEHYKALARNDDDRLAFLSEVYRFYGNGYAAELVEGRLSGPGTSVEPKFLDGLMRVAIQNRDWQFVKRLVEFSGKERSRAYLEQINDAARELRTELATVEGIISVLR